MLVLFPFLGGVVIACIFSLCTFMFYDPPFGYYFLIIKIGNRGFLVISLWLTFTFLVIFFYLRQILSEY